jgi:hypothetical protein
MSNVRRHITPTMNVEQLAGFFSAHSVWSVSDGGPLVPIYASSQGDGKPEMKRLAHEQLEDGVAAGRALLEGELDKDRVLIFDGLITLNGEKVDALVVEWRSVSTPEKRMTLGIPYTPGTANQRFLVHRPKVLTADERSRVGLEGLLNHFWSGVDQHTEGAKVWNEHMDQSK